MDRNGYLLFRWSRIVRIASGSVMKARMFITPPH